MSGNAHLAPHRLPHHAAGVCGQSAVAPVAQFHLDTEMFTFFFINLRGFVSHKAELEATLEELNFPTFVCLNETLLPGVRAMRTLSLLGYTLVSRRDRPNCSGWGGIAMFAKTGYEQNIVHIGDSEFAERSWHVLHTDRGPVSLCLWYRPPNPGEVDTIRSLDQEIEKFCKDTVGLFMVGDLNVHEESWLRHSSGTSIEGRELHEFCAERGLEQHIKEPTRETYLLDLVLSDLGSLVKTKVVAGIADHKGIWGSLRFPIPEAVVVERRVFLYSKAQWTDLKSALVATDWSALIVAGDADASASRFEEHLLDLIFRFIPSKIINDIKSSHEWLDDVCRRLIRRKRAAWGTDEFRVARDECTQGLLDAYHRFLKETRTKLGKLKPSSREWWRLSRSLMSLGSVNEVIPPLRCNDGSWATSASAKANLLAETFAEKSRLNDAELNDHSRISRGVLSQGDRFVPIRRRCARAVLKKLDVNSGTGPDRIAARVLRTCRVELEMPITLLARVVFNQARWPTAWRLHWVHPLYKKKSRADPKNYRGIHLTPQISKIVERMIGSTFLPWANRNGLFGANQYAYSTKRSHRDAMAVNICNWLLILEDGNLVGLYCSDVSGAFDRVDRERLVTKLRESGLNTRVVRFLESWLEDRRSVVVVGGEFSLEEVLSNTVFQGTVLGPPLWNIFYADAAPSVRSLRYREVVFADDFNSWKRFKSSTHHSEIYRQNQRCQANLHEWGRANSVQFDASKESFHILHRTRGCGENFALLGLEFDMSLRMAHGVGVLAREAGWRLQSVLRPRRFFTEWQIFNLYKSQVLSYVESATVGYYHAAPSVLRPLDRVQERLLREMGVSAEDALRRYKLAPLPSRRDMAMLGMLHRIVLGEAPSQLASLFPFCDGHHAQFTRLAVRRHDRQFRVPSFRTDVLQRSVFGLVIVYNLLPPRVVACETVGSFQSMLQHALRNAAMQGVDRWFALFSPRFRPVRALHFQAFFQ